MAQQLMLHAQIGDTASRLFDLLRLRKRSDVCREDYQSAEGMSAAQQKQLWHDLASGAESGMDFTSRWFSNPDNITTIQTTRIIPAELNAYLYQMESNVAELADHMGNSTLAANFRDFAAARKVAINTLMYSETEGQGNALRLHATVSSWRVWLETCWLYLFVCNCVKRVCLQ